MEFSNSHILSTDQFDRAALLQLFGVAAEMEQVIANGGSKLLDGKIMATLFFEPSTRTRFSFESAMCRLGGKVISNADMMATSSIKKRETLFDTGKMASRFADVIAMRHPQSGSVAELATGSDVPVLNGGDGSNDHPTQGLLDTYTIWKEFGDLSNVKVALVGDLKYGRVPHSQAKLLAHLGAEMVFVSPKALEMPREICAELTEAGVKFSETENLEEVTDVDVIAMTRVQEERFDSAAEYEKYADAYILDMALLSKAKEKAIVMHPLPRVNEIAKEVDDDPRARYFDQVHNGVAIRMALLKLILT